MAFFLFLMEKKCGVISNVLLWIRVLCTSPLASVITVFGLTYFPFLEEVDKATYPPSPSLFAIAIEPLAVWLHQECGFGGVTRAGRVHELS